MPKAAELISVCRQLDKPDDQVRIDRMNANIGETNAKRRAKGLGPIRWTLRGEQWVIEDAA